MRSWRSTPLAWRNLTHHRPRLLVAVCGIGFAVVLMFAETGFENALFDSTVQVLEDLNADLVISSAAYKSLVFGETFDRQRIYQVRGCAGVKAAHPFYIQLFGAMWKGPGRKAYPIRALACDVSQPVLAIPEVARCAAELEAPNTVLFDIKSKDKYGVPRSREGILQLRGAELSDRSVRPVGAFAMGTDFVCDGNIILSDRNFARYFPDRAPGQDPLSVVDLGVVQLEDPARAREVRSALGKILPGDVKVWTKGEFIAAEKWFWNKSTGVGFIFRLGKWIGFLVGVVICYQILNADLSDHLGEFATLKAMGYRNRYFVGIVLQEAVYLSVLSFLPGLLVSFALYDALARWTGLLMMLTAPRGASVFLLTVVMCAVSGALAMRKVLSADPADLY